MNVISKVSFLICGCLICVGGLSACSKTQPVEEKAPAAEVKADEAKPAEEAKPADEGNAIAKAGNNKEAIQKVVREHSDELRGCYESVLAKTPGLKGRILLSWIIDSDGAVSETTLKETSMNNKEVEDCLVAKVNGWKFEGLVKEGKTQIEYPFVFEAADPESVKKEVIQNVVRAHSGELRECYESALDKTPGLKGRILLSWMVDGEGVVSETTLKETSMNNKDMEDCVVAKVNGWKFEGLVKEGKTQIEYPFVFDSGE